MHISLFESTLSFAAPALKFGEDQRNFENSSGIVLYVSISDDFSHPAADHTEILHEAENQGNKKSTGT